MARHRTSSRDGPILAWTKRVAPLQGIPAEGSQLRSTVKVAWPDDPKAIGPRLRGDALSRWNQLRTWRGAESPDQFLGCIGTKSSRGGVFGRHRRQCHLSPRVRADSWMVWQDLRMKREDAAIGWYWTPWMTSWLWVENLQRWESNPLSSGYGPDGSPFAPPAGLGATHGGGIRTALLLSAGPWMEWKLDVPTGNAPVASVLQTEWFTCSIGHENGSGAWGLHSPGRLLRTECGWLHPSSPEICRALQLGSF